MPTINIAPIIRFVLYLLGSIALLTVSYAVDKEWAGDAEVRYVTGLAGLLFILAAAKTGVSDSKATLVGTVTSETGETGTISATLDAGEAPVEDDDGLSYEEAGGKPYNDYGYGDEARLT